MIPLKLVLRNLFGKKLRAIRTLLTIGSIAVAVLLLCILRSFVTTLDAAVETAAKDRLIVQSAVSLFVSLPPAYLSKIQGVDGVQSVTHMSWFGGTYKKNEPPGSQFAVLKDSFLEVYDEIDVVEGSVEEFMNRRNTCIVGRDTAAKYGFQVGDNIPVTSELYVRTDGQPWTFEVAGIYESRSPNVDQISVHFDYEYLRQARDNGDVAGPDGVSIFVVDIEDGREPTDVMRAIDEMYENGPQRVTATSEAAFQAGFVSLIGNIPVLVGAIGAGVLFAILLATLNTMLMAAREQTRDIGVLKALGFEDGAVFAMMLTQSMAIAIVGGAIGIGLALLLTPSLSKAVSSVFPNYRLADNTLPIAVGMILLLGIVAGLTPAFQARRLKTVEALSRRV